MKLGNLKIYFFLFIFCFFNSTYLVALDEVKTVPDDPDVINDQ